MLTSQPMVLEICTPKNLNDSTCSTSWPFTESAGKGVLFFRKSITVQSGYKKVEGEHFFCFLYPAFLVSENSLIRKFVGIYFL